MNILNQLSKKMKLVSYQTTGLIAGKLLRKQFSYRIVSHREVALRATRLQSVTRSYVPKNSVYFTPYFKADFLDLVKLAAKFILRARKRNIPFSQKLNQNNCKFRERCLSEILRSEIASFR